MQLEIPNLSIKFLTMLLDRRFAIILGFDNLCSSSLHNTSNLGFLCAIKPFQYLYIQTFFKTITITTYGSPYNTMNANFKKATSQAN